MELRRRQMTAMAFRVTGQFSVCSAVCLDWQQRHIKGPRYRPFVKGIHRWPVDCPHKVTGAPKMLPFYDVIMVLFMLLYCSCVDAVDGEDNDKAHGHYDQDHHHSLILVCNNLKADVIILRGLNKLSTHKNALQCLLWSQWQSPPNAATIFACTQFP